EDLKKVPPAPPSLHDTVLFGVVGELEVSVTVAWNSLVLLRATVAGFGEPVVLVVSSIRLPTVSDDDAELVLWAGSPPYDAVLVIYGVAVKVLILSVVFKVVP